MAQEAAAEPDPLDGVKPILAFLSDPRSYPDAPGSVSVTETHMSLVFIAGERVYKIKKPIRLAMMDFTTLDARRRNCEREFLLNQRLAPEVYLGIVPVTREPDGKFMLDGSGPPVEWVVVMRRLEESRLLDHMLLARQVQDADIERLCRVLAKFYREAPVRRVSPAEHLARWRRSIELVEQSLSDPVFALPASTMMPTIRFLHDFIDRCPALLTGRAEQGRIVDGHGDLRPEHVHVGPEILIIDRLEFDEGLRSVDPFDEAAFLGLECERLGAPWIGPRLIECLSGHLKDEPPPPLLRFYRCYRACLRASLSIEHLRDAHPRTPDKWPRQAREYLALALGSLP